ncbi:MAG TPA: YidB family protein [Thermoanaerobaculaceae bacterium]|nr:YidB family protein [Thermoanaerobaculaceae bacterium]
MGLLDGLLGNLVGSLTGNDPQHASLLNSVMSMVTNQQTGGIGGLLSAFQGNGLGHLVESWISTGKNLPVSAQQLEQVLGSGKIAELAKGAGLTPDVVKSKLSEFLPMIVDKLTPNGVIPK